MNFKAFNNLDKGILDLISLCIRYGKKYGFQEIEESIKISMELNKRKMIACLDIEKNMHQELSKETADV